MTKTKHENFIPKGNGYYISRNSAEYPIACSMAESYQYGLLKIAEAIIKPSSFEDTNSIMTPIISRLHEFTFFSIRRNIRGTVSFLKL